MGEILRRVAIGVCLVLATPAEATIFAMEGARPFEQVAAQDDFSAGNCIFAVCNRGGFITSTPDDPSDRFSQIGLGGIVGFYPNGGSESMISIRMNVAGTEIDQFQFDVSNGFGTSVGSPQFIWIRAYREGAPVGFDFTFDVPKPTTFTVWSETLGEFDEVRVQSYDSVAARDLGVETTYGAAIVGGYIAGTLVPEPNVGLLTSLGLAWIGVARRERRRSG